MDNYIENAEFKRLAKLDKSIKPALRKANVGVPAMIGDRQIKFVFSSEDIDRDFDKIMQAGIDFSAFLTNPVIFWHHESGTPPIGKCVSIAIEDNKLVGVVEFAPASNPIVGEKAEGIYQLCKEGYISTVSIGFMATEWAFADEDTRYAHNGADVYKSELVEVSIVGIPSNRSAIIQEIGGDNIHHAGKESPPIKYRAHRLQRILACMD